MARKFYKQVFEIIIFSEYEPLNEGYIEDVLGRTELYINNCHLISTIKLTAKETADQVSDPELFNLDEDGNDIEDV
mgnify:CR=1 FL=1